MRADKVCTGAARISYPPQPMWTRTFSQGSLNLPGACGAAKSVCACPTTAVAAAAARRQRGR